MAPRVKSVKRIIELACQGRAVEVRMPVHTFHLAAAFIQNWQARYLQNLIDAKRIFEFRKPRTKKSKEKPAALSE